MKTINILPTKIAVFDCEQSVLNKYLDNINKINWQDKNLFKEITDNSAGWIELDREDNKELCSWIEKCIDILRINFQFPFEKISLTNIWLNKQTTNTFHNTHTHPNSFLSGVLYLTSDDGETVFIRKDEWKNNIFFYPSSADQLSYIRPLAGKLIIFPSSLKHLVTINSSVSNRYTIAFNAFPEGNIGSFTQGLNIKIENFKKTNDSYKNNISLQNKEYIVL